VVSLLGYCLSIITVFTTAAVVMIGLFNGSTSEKVRHYPHPRPEIERTVTGTNMEPRLFMVVPGAKDASPAKDLPGRAENAPEIKDASPAKDVPEIVENAPEIKDASPAKDVKDSRPVTIEKAVAKKRKHERFAYLHKPTRQRESYPAAVDYGALSGYRPGLDSQR